MLVRGVLAGWRALVGTLFGLQVIEGWGEADLDDLPAGVGVPREPAMGGAVRMGGGEALASFAGCLLSSLARLLASSPEVMRPMVRATRAIAAQQVVT